MAGTYTDARKRAIYKYLKDKTDDIRLRVPKGTKELWKEAAEKQGMSMTAYVVETMSARIEKESRG